MVPTFTRKNDKRFHQVPAPPEQLLPYANISWKKRGGKNPFIQTANVSHYNRHLTLAWANKFQNAAPSVASSGRWNGIYISLICKFMLFFYLVQRENERHLTHLQVKYRRFGGRPEIIVFKGFLFSCSNSGMLNRPLKTKYPALDKNK